MKRVLGLAICWAAFLLIAGQLAGIADAASLDGELRQWHKVTLTLDGPQAAEDGDPNPFLDYRLQVTFRHAETGLVYNVPGYFAADGDAANTSATSGNKWRAHLSPDKAGTWTYAVSFRKGPGVAISDAEDAGSPVVPIDGLRGSFEIAKTDKTGRDLRGKGRLDYVGKHHLQFAGTGEYFLKAGVDAPENFLAYRDFDGEFKSDGQKDNLVKDWGPHVQDWREGDPTWQDGKGKGIVGAINYLAAQGLNVFSFLTMNIDGDDRNVFLYTDYDERERVDCSRMDQWEIVFSHGTKMGMYLHFKTQEAENVHLLDDAKLGPQRKLYYRELIARFAHHPALNWNLGEEVGLNSDPTTQDKKDWAEYFWTHDPYKHHIVIHNGDNHYDLLGPADSGGSHLTGFSLQTNRADFSNVHNRTLDYLQRSVEAGKPWVVACDEPGDASHALITDAEDPTRDNPRKNALWGNLMAGGAGVEWYFGYQHPHSDLTCQDYRVREKMWKQSRIALEFFADHEIPFWDMANANEQLSQGDAYCLCQPGRLYLVYLKNGGEAALDLSDVDGVFEIQWFNPRDGGPLASGSAAAVAGGRKRLIGQPPQDKNQDWLAVLHPGDPNRNYPPGVSAGSDQTVMLPREGNAITVELAGAVSDDGKPGGAVKCQWWAANAKAEKVRFKNNSSASTEVSLTGAGEYRLRLTANDGEHSSSDTVKITVEPFSPRFTRVFLPAADAYLEGGHPLNNQHLKVEGERRIAYMKFELKELPPQILEAKLKLTENGDTGGGTLKVHRGSHSDWTDLTLDESSAPAAGEIVGEHSGPVIGGSVTIPVTPLFQGNGTYSVVLKLAKGGNDIWFGSSESNVAPELLITAEDPDGHYTKLAEAAAKEAATAPKKAAAEPDPTNALSAVGDFAVLRVDEFVPAYKDAARRALAINAAQYRGEFAAAEAKFDLDAGTYDVVLTSLTETDGESTYRVFVGGKKIGEVQNPPAERDYEAIFHRFEKVKLNTGDVIRVEFNSASNGKIPEGDGFAFARGRWRSVTFLMPGQVMPKPATAAPAPVVTSFEFTYDPAKAKKVHKQSGGIIVVEAEDFDAVDRQNHRTWYLTTADTTPDVKPDPDPNHAEGAIGGAYLEILPDTRSTHGDPLINGVNFSDAPGECSVLYYPVIFTEPGRYYVWVRTCCTGSEDNSLHVGLDGEWPASGQRMQWTGKHGEWQWDSRQRTARQHGGELGKIWLDVDKPGLHTIMFSMREDGFEFDRFLLTKEPGAMESKNSEPGPAASPTMTP